MRDHPSAEELSKLLRYDAPAGIFTHLVGGNGRIIGARAGAPSSDGWSLSINGKRYKGHNVAWIMRTGSLPPKPIKFRDGDRFNLCFNNLCVSTLGAKAPKPKPEFSRRIYRKDDGWRGVLVSAHGTYRNGPWPSADAARADLDARLLMQEEAADEDWASRRVKVAAQVTAARVLHRRRVGEIELSKDESTVTYKVYCQRWLDGANDRLGRIAERFDRVRPRPVRGFIPTWREGEGATLGAPHVQIKSIADDPWNPAWRGSRIILDDYDNFDVCDTEGGAVFVEAETNLVAENADFGFDGNADAALSDGAAETEDNSADWDGSPNVDLHTDDTEWT